MLKKFNAQKSSKSANFKKNIEKYCGMFFKYIYIYIYIYLEILLRSNNKHNSLNKTKLRLVIFALLRCKNKYYRNKYTHSTLLRMRDIKIIRI